MQPLVLDTNVVLDAFVFGDAAAQPIVRVLETGAVDWLATGAMRDELRRVLAYPQIAKRLASRAISADQVLARFDAHARLREPAPPAPARCTDADDQKFIDLAVAHRALLVSKDRAVLKLRKRLTRLGCPAVTPAYEAGPR
jgi:putative PIN family toxin of toxin-antitoxin system